MENRELKIMFSQSGNGGRLAKITLPIKWMDILNITPNDRYVKVTLTDNNEIIINKSMEKK